MKALIVDDDPKFRGYVAKGLEDSGIDSESAPDGVVASKLLREAAPGEFDVVLLDVMLPIGSGWEFLEELRASGNGLPVIFVTARDPVEERVKGLKLGADDYIIKPFAFSELLARIEAVLRRRQVRTEIVAGDLRLDLLRRTVTTTQGAVDLTPMEFDLLCHLVEHADHTLTRAELLKSVWNIEFDPGTNVVDVHIGRIRRKLGQEVARCIETVVGRGYRFASNQESNS